MAGLVPAITSCCGCASVDARDKRGHDGRWIAHTRRRRNHCSRLALVPDANSGLFTDMR